MLEICLNLNMHLKLILIFNYNWLNDFVDIKWRSLLFHESGMTTLII